MDRSRTAGSANRPRPPSPGRQERAIHLPLPLFAKRWHRRREAWNTPGDLFDARGYGVDVIPQRLAKAFVIDNHYAASFPAAQLSVGLFRTPPSGEKELSGVAVFSVPMNQRAIPRYTGMTPNQGVELGRFVLLPDTGFNAETWFLKRAFAALRAEKPTIRACISYCDPLERVNPVTATLQKQQHFGTIYQSHNARFGGRSEARTLIVTGSGKILSPRSLSKISSGDRGSVGAIRQLVEAGATPPKRTESLHEWLKTALQTAGFQRVRHPGNYLYAFGLDKEAKVVLAERLAGFEAYPKAPATTHR